MNTNTNNANALDNAAATGKPGFDEGRVTLIERVALDGAKAAGSHISKLLTACREAWQPNGKGGEGEVSYVEAAQDRNEVQTRLRAFAEANEGLEIQSISTMLSNVLRFVKGGKEIPAKWGKDAREALQKMPGLKDGAKTGRPTGSTNAAGPQSNATGTQEPQQAINPETGEAVNVNPQGAATATATAQDAPAADADPLASFWNKLRKEALAALERGAEQTDILNAIAALGADEKPGEATEENTAPDAVAVPRAA